MWRGAERAVEWLFHPPDDRGETVSAGPAATAKEQTGGSGSAVFPATYRLKAFIFALGALRRARVAVWTGMKGGCCLMTKRWWLMGGALGG